MVLRFPCVAFSVIALVVVTTTVAGIAVHAGAEVGLLVLASAMLEPWHNSRTRAELVMRNVGIAASTR